MRLAPCDALELAKLLERVDADVRVGADRDRDTPLEQRRAGGEAVSEIGLGRRAEADRAAVRGEEVELGVVRVGAVHDRRPLAEAAAAREQLDRPQPVLGEALLDLAWLLVGVDVERQPFALRVGADLLEPSAGHARTEWGATPTAIPSPRSVSTSSR